MHYYLNSLRKPRCFMQERGLGFAKLENEYGLRGFVRIMELDYLEQLFEDDEMICSDITHD